MHMRQHAGRLSKAWPCHYAGGWDQLISMSTHELKSKNDTFMSLLIRMY